MTSGLENDMRNLANFHRFKMAEPNKNQNSKQPDQPDAMWKLYFTLEINE